MRWNNQNYQNEAARRECRERGLKLGKWPGDPEEVGDEIQSSSLHAHSHRSTFVPISNDRPTLPRGVRDDSQRDVDVSGVVEKLRGTLEDVRNFLKRDRFPSKMVLEALARLEDL